MERRSVILGDLVGHDRAAYIAAKALERIRREMARGTLAKEGKPLTFQGVDSVIADYEASPDAVPATEYEVMVGVTFFVKAFPDVRPTAKGEAKIDFMLQTMNAGRG